MPPSPRAASESRMPRPARPVGWNWKNSMSSSGSPCRHDDAHPVAGQRVRVRRRLEDLAEPARRQHDGLRLEHLDLARGELVRHHARGPALTVDVVQEQVEHVVLVVELDLVLDALLVERLEDHVPRAVGREARPPDGGLAVVAGVTAEPALVDPPLRRPVERQAELLEVEHGVDRLAAHDLGGVLVDEEVTALDGVPGVPLPVVLLDVRQRGAHAALRGAGVGARRVELGEDGGAGLPA